VREGRPVRTLIVCPTFGTYGGMEAFVLALAEALRADEGLQLRVVFKRVRDFVLTPDFAELCRPFQVEFCDRGSPSLWRALRWADVVHGQNASPDVAIAASLLRKPIGWSIHNFLAPRPLIRRRLWQWAISLASSRWYISNFVWDTWEPEGRRPGSACVPTFTRLPKGYVEPAARRGFVFLGRLVPGKGVEVLLDAYEHAGLSPAEWPLVIIGDGPMRPELEDQVARRRLAGVTFLGFLEGTAKTTVLARSKWLVVPSNWSEPFGLVAREARHLSVPCVVTRDGGLPQAAGNDAIICPPGDRAGLAAALRQAAAMSLEDYQSRSERTNLELQQEQVPPAFYAAAYRSLARDGSFDAVAALRRSS
jgi:glycosyltransferase involved in cell wall biosynthesis